MSATKKIKKWSDAQLRSHLDKWKSVTNRIDPANREATRRWVDAIYQQYGYPPPKILWFSSPQSACFYQNIFVPQFTDDSDAMIQARLAEYESRYPDIASSGPWLDAKAVLASEKLQRPGLSIHLQLVVWPVNEIESEIQKTMNRREYHALFKRFWRDELLGTWWRFLMPHWGNPQGVMELGDIAWFKFCEERLGIPCQTEWMKCIEGLLDSCGFWWFHEKVCYVTERPTVIKRDNLDRLHCVQGPALQYADGSSLFALNGINVPEKVVRNNKALTAEDIEEVENSAVKRDLVLQYGFERYLKDLGGTFIDQVDETQFLTVEGSRGLEVFGLKGARLYRRENENGQPLVMVILKNSTARPDETADDYFVRVPPDTKTVRQAVAWTFGMETGEYAPVKET